MAESDIYLTLKSFSQGLYKEKGSRFLAFAWPVSSQDEIKPILERTRKEYHDARHHCYAYMLGSDKSVFRINDDGEPSGSAGRPILGQIKSHGLTNILIIVVRYFGGKLLGVSGLINAYRSAAEDAINNGETVEATVKDYYEILFPYPSLNEVIKILKEEGTGQSDHLFDTICRMKISFRVSKGDRILKRLLAISGMEAVYSGRR